MLGLHGKTILAVCIWLAALTGSSNANEDDAAIRIALDLCTDVPGEIENTRATLKAAGWQSDEHATFIALFNSMAAFKFKANDLDYTFSNAGFMAASVLGNSALGRDQIGMQSETNTLAVLGLPEGTPYCILTGPQSLLITFIEHEKFKDRSYISSDIVTQTMGATHDKVDAVVGSVEIEKLKDALSASDMSADDVAKIVNIMRPATIYILSSEVTQ